MALTVVKKNISLNVGQPNNFELICAMQGDNKSFEITATLYDVNKLYTISTNSIKLQGINPMGANIRKDVKSHTANTVTFDLTADMLAYDGLLKLVLVFTDSTTQLTTFPFVIKVVNAPGNTDSDDIKTVSALVEEAKKWAMMAKSYAVGTDNVVRPGDATDNSKYYYEQIKSLIDSGKIGNGKIVYYDTYDAFLADKDNIDNETLIVIKEYDMDINSGGSGSGNKTKTLMFFRDAINAYKTTDMKTMDYIGMEYNGKTYLNGGYMPSRDFNEPEQYEVVYCDNINMLFCVDNPRTGADSYLYFSTGDGKWCFHSIRDRAHAKLAYGNKHLIMIDNGVAYAIDDDSIIANRTNKINLDTSMAFSKMNGSDGSFLQYIAYGNGIFVAMGTRKISQYTHENVSFYTSDCKTWHELTGTFAFYGDFPCKIAYGNKQFIFFETGHSNDDCRKISILNSDNLPAGWKWQRNENISIPLEDYRAHFTDIVFDDNTNRFLFPFYNETTNTSGFYIYDGINWDKASVNKVIKLYDCIFYQGKLFGFIDYSHWVSVDDIQTYKYTDYGEMELPDPDFNHKTLGAYPKLGSYVLIDAPLWDINS